MAAAKFTTPKELLSSEYVTKSLDIVAISEGFKNYKLSLEHGTKVGDGFIGVIFKAQICEENDEKILNVLVKVPPHDENGNSLPERMNSFRNEVYFYKVLAPELIKFQEENQIEKSEGFLNFPKIYYADYDEKLFKSIIVMEDLKDVGYKNVEKHKPVDYDHAKLAVELLGRFHALSFALKKKKPEVFKKFKKIYDNTAEILESESFDGIIEMSIYYASVILQETLDDSDPAKEIFQNSIENFVAILGECYDGNSDEKHAVFTHGDCWINNLMFRGKDLVFIDYQDTRYCSPVNDLTYFIFICTDKSLREKHFDDLIKIYYQSLSKLLNRLGGDAESQFPFKTFLDHLKKFGKSGVLSGCCAISLLYFKADKMGAIAEKLQNFDRNEILEIIEMYKELNKDDIDEINQRIRDIIHDGVKLGYL